MKNRNLLVLVIVSVSPVTLVKPEVVIAPALAPLRHSRIIEEGDAGGAKVCAPLLV